MRLRAMTASRINHNYGPTLNSKKTSTVNPKESVFKFAHLFLYVSKVKSAIQGLQILLMSVVSVTSASQILESFWNIWSQVFSDFPARGLGLYTLS